MGVPADRTRYTDVYLQEVAELSEALEQALVGLERASDAPDRLRAAMRTAHTLKGSANTMDLPRTVEVAHAMESLIQAMADGRAAPTARAVDQLLGALDTVRELARSLTGAGEAETGVSGVVAGLRASAGESSAEPAAPIVVAERGETAALVAPIEGPVRHVTFRVGSTDYALPACDVLEIVQPRKIVPCPGVPEWVLGLTNIRGRIAPIVDVATRLGVGESSGEEGLLILAPYAEEQVALLVAEIGGLVDIGPEDVARSATTVATESDAVVGVARTRGGLVVLLDRERLLARGP